MQKIIISVVIREGNKVLVVKEAKERCYGQYNFPGGKLDKDYSVFTAAIREAKEETGYDIKLNNLLTIQNQFCVSQDNYKTAFVFTGEIIGGKIKFNKKEILDVEWIDIDELLNMTDEEIRNTQYMHPILKCLKKGITYPLDIIEEFINREDLK